MYSDSSLSGADNGMLLVRVSASYRQITGLCSLGVIRVLNLSHVRRDALSNHESLLPVLSARLVHLSSASVLELNLLPSQCESSAESARCASRSLTEGYGVSKEGCLFDSHSLSVLTHSLS